MFARDGLVKDKMVVHRAIALPKGKNKPDLQYKRTGENVYEIPETEKYVGSYDTAVRCNRNLHIFKKWKRQPLIRLPFVVLRLYKIFIFNSFKEPTSSDSKYIRY